jgi:hypothetical protein
VVLSLEAAVHGKSLLGLCEQASAWVIITLLIVADLAVPEILSLSIARDFVVLLWTLFIFGPPVLPLIIDLRRWRRDEPIGSFRSLGGLTALLCVALSLSTFYFYYCHGLLAEDLPWNGLLAWIGPGFLLIALIGAGTARPGIRGPAVLSADISLLWCWGLSGPRIWPIVFEHLNRHLR